MRIDLFLLILLAHLSFELAFNVTNHSFIFISGWPQSGTSFVHQVIDSSSKTSSMIQKCEERLGKRCVNWNHEGQWILKGSTRIPFQSGSVVPVLRWTDDVSASVRDEWAPYWDASQPYLVEKSPQSFLKVPALRAAFQGAVSIRFVIVIKHPVTLNIATPKASGWRYPRSAAQPHDLSQPEVTAAQRMTNFQHFTDMLSNTNGSLGWIPAMEQLVLMLRADPLVLQQSVRIIRYEHFARPVALCNSLFDFVFNSSHDGRRVCGDLFRPSSAASAATTSRKSRIRDRDRPRRRLSATDDEDEAARRALRLRSTPTASGLNFRSELVAESARQRMSDFLHMTQRLPRQQQDHLQALGARLKSFGYSLYELYQPRQSLLSPWELLMP